MFGTWMLTTRAALLALTLTLALPAAGLAQGGGGDPFAQAGESDPFAQAMGQGGSGAAADPFAGAGAAFDQAGGAADASGGPQFLGFVQAEQANHVGKVGAQDRNIILSDVRARLKTALTGESSSAFLKVDFLQDAVRERTVVDLREARLLWTPVRWMDVNVGMQVSTWGVGDMVFINDLFPKNWVANFTGQSLEFLKEPANAARISVYGGPITWDIVYTPRFAPDVVPDGCRFAVFDPNSQSVVAQPANCTDTPAAAPADSQHAEDGEVATRLMADIGQMQAALYTYRGFWKSPRGVQWIDPTTGQAVQGTPDPAVDTLVPFHPRLNVYGLSLEGQTGPGILSLEAGYYDSVDDRKGTDPLIENSTWKTLLGYRADLTARFSAGVQWLGEAMQDFHAYEQNLPPGSPVKPKVHQRNTYTLRLTYKAQQETLYLNFFGYKRPQDHDAFYKLWLSKRMDNHLEVSTGVNMFEGADGYEDRDFGMLRNDDNAFARFTYNF